MDPDVRNELDRRFATVTREEIMLREYVDARFREKEHALEAITVERERLAAALRGGIAAETLAGDDRLREYVQQLVQEIRVLLEAADKLEVARISAVQRELSQAMEAAAEGIRKAEINTEKRFENVNEWRAQSADRERSQAEERSQYQGLYMPREVADAQFARLQESVATLLADQAALAGARQAVVERHNTVLSTTSIIYLIVAVAGVLATLAVATHGFA